VGDIEGSKLVVGVLSGVAVSIGEVVGRGVTSVVCSGVIVGMGVLLSITMKEAETEPPPPESITMTKCEPGEALGTVKDASMFPEASATAAVTAAPLNIIFTDISGVKPDPVTDTLVCIEPLEGSSVIEGEADA